MLLSLQFVNIKLNSQRGFHRALVVPTIHTLSFKTFFFFFWVINALFISLDSARIKNINIGWKGFPDRTYLLYSPSKTNTDKSKFKTRLRFMRFPDKTRLNVFGRSSAIDLWFGHMSLHNFQTTGHLVIIFFLNDVSRSTNLSFSGISHFLSLPFQNTNHFLSVLWQLVTLCAPALY